MEISQKFFDEVEEKVKEFQSNTNYELEAKNDKKVPLNREVFYRVVQYFISVYKQLVQDEDMLDILFTQENIQYRVRLYGKDNILSFCKENEIHNHDAVQIISKKRDFDKLSFDEVNFNIALAEEVPVLEEQKGEILDMMYKSLKLFRYKKRFSLAQDIVQYDMTIVKTARDASTFASSGVLTDSDETYEIEVELVKRGKDVKEQTKGFIQAIVHMYAIMYDEDHVISEYEKRKVQQQYLNVTHNLGIAHLGNALAEPSRYFIGPKPVTLEIHNLKESALGVISIWDNDYCVTEKADGERCNMFVNEDGKCYLINSRLQVKYTGVNLINATNCVLDGEYLSDSNIFAAFDMYFLQRNNICDQPFMDPKVDTARHTLLTKFCAKFAKSFAKVNMVVRVKEFSDSTKANCKKILDKAGLDEYEYKIDGLIFTPKSLAVGGMFKKDSPQLVGTWPIQYKWKPPEDNTIDFLVQYQQGSLNNHKIVFNNSQGYKLLNLYVGYNPIKWKKIQVREFLEGTIKRSSVYIPTTFIPGNVTDKDFATCQVKMIKKYNNKGECQNGDEIQDKCIVEFKYDNGWVPLRVRKDKTDLYRSTGKLSGTANDFGAALNVWRSICNPVTEEILLGEKELPALDTQDDDAYYFRMIARDKYASKKMLDFHNYWIKNKTLISKLQGKKSLFDIACGRGGDLSKWMDAKIPKIFGIDYSRDNIENPDGGALDRVLKGAFKQGPKRINLDRTQLVFLTMDASKPLNPEQIQDADDKYVAEVLWGVKQQDRLKKFYKYVTDGFEVCTCMFALHYFYKDEDTLETFAQNVDRFLKPGGYFIGTCLDGFKVKETLARAKIHNGESLPGVLEGRTLWDIRRLYKDNDPTSITYGEEVEIYMESIGKIAKEYLVNLSLLVNKLAKYNILLVKDDDPIGLPAFENYRETYDKLVETTERTDENGIYYDNMLSLSQTEKDYSFMNMWFCFRKGGESTKTQPRKVIIK